VAVHGALLRRLFRRRLEGVYLQRVTGSIERTAGYEPGERKVKPRTEWKGAISSVRDNGDLTLAVGDQIEHSDFGQGKVIDVSGEPPKQTAEVVFAGGAKKRLLVRVAPITKL
jgi:DNA helicase-2/ATP-dependent DNA helicase PcrA